ncbi:ATP-binding cassette, subfamily B, MsbA [Nitrosovibrio sp. Nv17]|nr:ATP-binding cassette, subfamily B, MsbA [Nitrosovibrio sp. Nv17]
MPFPGLPGRAVMHPRYPGGMDALPRRADADTVFRFRFFPVIRHVPHAMGSRLSSLRLTKYIAPYWEVFVLGLAGMAATAVLTLPIAMLVVPLLDDVLVGRSGEAVQWILPAFIGLIAVRGVASYAGTWAMHWACGRAAMDLQADLFDRVLALEPCHGADPQDGGPAVRPASEVSGFFRALIDLAAALARDALTVAGLLVWMFYLDWRLAAPALALAITGSLVARWSGRRLRRAETRMRQAENDLGRIFREAMRNHRVIALYGGREHEARRMRTAARHAHVQGMKRAGVGAVHFPLYQLMAATALAAMMYEAARWIPVREITAGGIVSVVVATLMLGMSLQRIAAAWISWREGQAAAAGVLALLHRNTGARADAGGGSIVIGRAQGELRFDAVSFHRGASSIAPGFAPHGVRDITLAIRPGETVALAGASAADKNILMNLVPRFIVPTAGRIWLDGRDLADIDLASLHANIALVSEDTMLFDDTVAANIAYGAMGFETEARIIAAVQAARATEFIREMPQGLQTMVGEGGVALTGGQRLRIAIARALLKNPPIVLVNETPRTLDFETNQHVQAALETLMRGRTALVVAHRLSTAEGADRIVVLQEGRIAETGDHHGLLARRGIYAGLVQAFV